MPKEFTLKKKPLIFWGATGQAKMLHECLITSEYELVSLFDTDQKIASPFADVPIFHEETAFITWIKNKYKTQSVGCLVTVGGEKGQIRFEIQEKLEKQGLTPVIIKHGTAHVAYNAVVGCGSQILPMACVNVDVRLGKACIINSGAIIEHECSLGDGVHIAPGARLAGLVDVGDFATVFCGATVIPRIKIGTGAVIGAGAVVIEDVPPFSVVVGNPARVIKTTRPTNVQSDQICASYRGEQV